MVRRVLISRILTVLQFYCFAILGCLLCISSKSNFNKKDYLCFMTTRDEILSKLTELKPLLLKDYAVREIGLFGSFSDNSFTEDSDIDLLVDLERPRCIYNKSVNPQRNARKPVNPQRFP